jgi:hypothetical protein
MVIVVLPGTARLGLPKLTERPVVLGVIDALSCALPALTLQALGLPTVRVEVAMAPPACAVARLTVEEAGESDTAKSYTVSV